jgi:UDP-glucose 4-epimerase
VFLREQLFEQLHQPVDPSGRRGYAYGRSPCLGATPALFREPSTRRDPAGRTNHVGAALKRIGITGAAGFIGSHLTDRLLAEGYEVIGVDDLSRGTLLNLDSALDNPKFRFEVIDCGDRRALRGAFKGCDGIVHLAAKKIPRYGGALATLEENVRGSEVVANVALTLDADLVVASTSDVYGNGNPPFAEDDNVVLGPPTTRRWAYAVSKLYDEHVALALAEERGLRVTILRLFGSYGPRNHPTWWGGPQSAFIETLLDGNSVEIHGDGQQVRTFTYISDTIDGFVRALRTPEARGEVINVGGTTPTAILRLAELIQSMLEIPQPLRARFVPYESLPGRYQDVRIRIPDVRKAKRILGFKARIPLEKGLVQTIEWHRERRATEQEAARA